MNDMTDETLAQLAGDSKAWPFLEARNLVKRLDRLKDQPETVLFETGYGPSGLPHIGTFGEVARTRMVQHAFEVLTGRKTHLICFSDDMDGLRKVPDNIPNAQVLSDNLHKPLSSVPDPFGTHESFSDHNNARLQTFLDQFGFDYEFVSATQRYKSGALDETLLRMLDVYDKVMAIILPTLGGERQKTYSPFLPISPTTGKVLQVPMKELNVKTGTLVFDDPDAGETVELPVTGGHVKCQWKADWAMRWTALGVDYEMAGKDLIDSVRLSGKICRALGGTPPDGFSYELFNDENGEKISKSKGNGITIDEWLSYASPQSLSLFMYQKPKTAKRLFFDIIPKNVDEYLTFLSKYPDQERKDQVNNPVWHIHGGKPPEAELPISFALLLNLVSASNASDPEVLWGFIRRYAPDATPAEHPVLDHLVGYAISYYNSFVKPQKVYRAADERETKALADLQARFGELADDADGGAIQSVVYEVGKNYEFDPLRGWFQALYEILLGQKQGPRFGNFVELYGLEESRELIGRALAGELV